MWKKRPRKGKKHAEELHEKRNKEILAKHIFCSSMKCNFHNFLKLNDLVVNSVNSTVKQNLVQKNPTLHSLRTDNF